MAPRSPLPSVAAVVLVTMSLTASDTGGSVDTQEPCPSVASAGAVADAGDLFGSLDRLLAATAAADTCPRPAAGSVVEEPASLHSQNGVLKAEFDYYTTTDTSGRILYCFQTPDGTESPTLHLRPGDVLDLTLHDRVPHQSGFSDWPVIAGAAICGAAKANQSSVNMHFHGTNTAPVCHADGVIHTIVNSGQTFRYRLKFPKDEPPGLYWYHPHIYGLAEAAVQGGASGAIVVDGIENLQPAVAGLPERILIVRDQQVVNGLPPPPSTTQPSWDLSLNYVPVSFPTYTPAVIRMRPGEQEFWRVANSSADTILDLQLEYDGAAQPLEIVSMDGVPIGSQDGTRQGRTFVRSHVLIPPAGRAEFIVTGPAATVQSAMLLTRHIDTGPVGDVDPQRPLATIALTHTKDTARTMPFPSAAPNPQRFEGLDQATVTARRHLYFSEVEVDAKDAKKGWGLVNFFITVDGNKPTTFEPNNPPAITTTQGSVEDWTIENRAQENHEFHMHQIHFEVLKRNGTPVDPIDRQFRDTIQIPYWSGHGPFPSITVRMDFRGADIGDFVYHCHILGHEDRGMMEIIRVQPAS